MKQLSIKVQKNYVLIYCALLLFTLGKALYRINISVPDGLTNRLILMSCIVMLIHKLLIERSSNKKGLLLFIGISAILFVDSIPSGAHELLYLFIIIWSIHGNDLNKIVKFEFWIILIITLTALILVGVNIIDNKYVLQNGVRARWCLGFVSWTILPFQYNALVFGYTYFYQKKIKLWQVIPLELIGFLIYKMTDTKTSFIVLTIYLLIYFSLRNKLINLKKYRIVLTFLPWLIAAESFVIVLLYEKGNQFLQNIDVLINWRLLYSAKSIAQMGIHFLSRTIEWTGDVFVDNCYINILITWGIVGLLFVLFIYSYLIYFFAKKNDLIMLMILIITVCLGVLWDRMINYPEVYFVLYFSSFFEKNFKRLRP